jgi:hypothetical protein
MKKRTLFVVIIIIAIVGASCQKYEDGPSMSFRSPEKRLIKKWKLTNIYKDYDEKKDNNDSTFEFKENKEFEGHITNFYNLKMSKFSGTWQFTNNKKTIVCSGTVYSSLGNYAKEISFEITQLRSSDLWLTETFYNDSVPPESYGKLEYHYIPN